MSQLQRNRSVAAETMRITVVGGLAIAAVIVVAILLIQSFRKDDKPASEEKPPET